MEDAEPGAGGDPLRRVATRREPRLEGVGTEMLLHHQVRGSAIGHPAEPSRQLRGFAEFIADDVAGASYRGCPFINTIAELPDPEHPARRLIAAHKARQLQRIAALCAQAGLAEPKLAAIHLTLLLEGAQTGAQNGSVPRLRDNLLKLVDATLAIGAGSGKPARR